jgi:hypothetical protein
MIQFSILIPPTQLYTNTTHFYAAERCEGCTEADLKVRFMITGAAYWRMTAFFYKKKFESDFGNIRMRIKLREEAAHPSTVLESFVDFPEADMGIKLPKL